MWIKELSCSNGEKFPRTTERKNQEARFIRTGMEITIRGAILLVETGEFVAGETRSGRVTSSRRRPIDGARATSSDPAAITLHAARDARGYDPNSEATASDGALHRPQEQILLVETRVASACVM
jgi:hypothetical protein